MQQSTTQNLLLLTFNIEVFKVFNVNSTEFFHHIFLFFPDIKIQKSLFQENIM